MSDLTQVLTDSEKDGWVIARPIFPCALCGNFHDNLRDKICKPLFGVLLLPLIPDFIRFCAYSNTQTFITPVIDPLWGLCMTLGLVSPIKQFLKKHISGRDLSIKLLKTSVVYGIIDAIPIVVRYFMNVTCEQQTAYINGLLWTFVDGIFV